MRCIVWLLLLLMVCSAASGKQYTTAEIHAMFVRRPAPEYPLEVRRHHITGTGRFRLFVDERGKVTDVTIIETTKNVQLDRSAIRAFRQWRARPGPKREVDVPATFWFPNHSSW